MIEITDWFSFGYGIIITVLIFSVLWFIYEILEYGKIWEMEE